MTALKKNGTKKNELKFVAFVISEVVQKRTIFCVQGEHMLQFLLSMYGSFLLQVLIVYRSTTSCAHATIHAS